MNEHGLMAGSGEAVRRCMDRYATPDGRLPFIAGIGRTVLALGQAITIVATPSWAFTPPTNPGPGGFSCLGVAGASPWCIGQHLIGADATRSVIVVLLLIVASGVFPRYTAIPHWWISFGAAVSFTLPDGGDQVAQNITLLLIPLLLCDGRRWQWTRRAPFGYRRAPSFWSGLASVAYLACRLQVVAIYLDSSLSKLAQPEWLNGTELYYVFNDVRFGLPAGNFRDLILSLTANGMVVSLITWGAIATELLIGLLLLKQRPEFRARACALAVLLHLAIFLTIGLFSFAAIMIGSVLIASGLDVFSFRSSSSAAAANSETAND